MKKLLNKPEGQPIDPTDKKVLKELLGELKSIARGMMVEEEVESDAPKAAELSVVSIEKEPKLESESEEDCEPSDDEELNADDLEAVLAEDKDPGSSDGYENHTLKEHLKDKEGGSPLADHDPKRKFSLKA